MQSDSTRKHLLPTTTQSPSLFHDGDIQFPARASKFSAVKGKFKILAAGCFVAFVVVKLTLLGVHEIQARRHHVNPFEDSDQYGKCSDWTLNGDSSVGTAELALELTPDQFSFNAYNAPRVNGTVVYAQDEDPSPDNKVRATIRAELVGGGKKDPAKAWKEVKVCEHLYYPWSELGPGRAPVEKRPDGFVVLTDEGRGLIAELKVSIKFPLPKDPGSRTNVPRFMVNTATSQLANQFEDISGLDIRMFSVAAGGDVRAKNSKADGVFVGTSTRAAGEGITGVFRAVNVVNLRAFNSGSLSAEVHLDGTANATDPSWVYNHIDLETNTGDIQSRLNLTCSGAKKASECRWFGVNAKSSSGDVQLNFVDAPVDSTLNVDAQTKYGTAEVILHPTFHGRYELDAIPQRREIQDTRSDLPEDEYPSDPSGEGRQRILWHDYQGLFRHSGAVVWGRRELERGLVKIGTVWGRVRLVF